MMKERIQINSEKLKDVKVPKLHDIHGRCIDGIKRKAKNKEVVLVEKDYFYETYKQLVTRHTNNDVLTKDDYFKTLSILFKKIAEHVSKECVELPLPKGLGSLTVFEYQQPLYPSHWRDVLRDDCKTKNIINTGGKTYRCVRLGLLPAKNNPAPKTWNWIKKNSRSLDETFFKELYKHKYENNNLIKIKVRDEINHMA